MKLIQIPLILVSTLLAASCEKPATSGSAQPSAALKALFAPEEPPGAVSVLQARKQPVPGTSLTVTGRIAGDVHPFTEGYAAFILADDSLVFCNEVEGDQCATPWDACCEASEKIKAARLSVQLPGPDGRPLAESLQGVGGLKPLDLVTVTGIVAEGASAENLVLNASALYRKP